MKKIFIIVCILLYQYNYAQIDPNNLLILNTGTTAEINAISPQVGALVYNTDTNKVYQFNGAVWVITSSSNGWIISGNNQYSAVSGNVGIGITNPSEKLDVNGRVQFGNTGATNGVVQMVGRYSGINHLNTYGSERSTGATVIGYAVQPKAGAAGYVSSAQNVALPRGLLRNSGDLQFLTASSAQVNVGTDVALTSRFIVKNAGNVGIGTANPNYKLSIASTTNGAVWQQFSNTDTGATSNDGYYLGIGANEDAFVWNAENTALRFYTNNTEKMRISNTGNLGIGTTNPNEKLEINGSIRITDGSEGTGKILVSDANGTGTWTNPSSVSDSDWTVTGNNMSSAVSGNVGIGTASPAYRLDVRENSTAAGIGTQEAISVSSTVGANATTNYGIYTNATPSATGTVTNNYGIFGDVNMPAGGTATNTYGVYGRTLLAGTVTANSFGVLGSADVLSGGSVTSTIRGGHFAARVRVGGSASTAYGVLSSAQHEGNLSGTNYGTYSIARPLSGSSVQDNFGSYSNASIPVGATVNSNNFGSLSNSDNFGTISGSNFASYNIGRIRGGTLSGTNYGVYSHTGHISGTINGSNFGIYSFSPGDANSTVGTNYAGYFNADHTGSVTNNNFGLYSIARTRNGGSIGGSNYAGYFYAAANNSGGGGYGTIAGSNFGVRIIMSSNGVAGNTWGVYQSGDAGTENYFQNTVGINTTGGAGVLNVNGVATKTGGGVWAVFSDRRSKENIKNYTKGLTELLQLRPVSFTYKKSFNFGAKTHVGFIAQEVEKVVPSMVTKKDMHGLKDFRQVDANEVTFMLINAVKELKTENETLKTENKSMLKRLEALERSLQKLKK